jgi:O-methyltransferase
MITLQKISDLTQAVIASDEVATIATINALTKAVRAATQNGVRGHVAEFGTMTGRTATSLAIICNTYFNRYLKNDIRHGFKETRELHLFDSFVGLPAATETPDLENPHVKGGIWTEGTCKGLTVEQLSEVVKTLNMGGRTRIFDGWFRETVDTIPGDSKYSVIHIDCDLYQSTLDALDPLFRGSALSRGCQILFDDYNCAAASNMHGERLAWSELIERHSVKCELIEYYAVSGARFIVHSYDTVK